MIELELTPQETQLVAEELESHISDMGMEIADTDRLDYRKEIKARRRALEKVLGALRGG